MPRVCQVECDAHIVAAEPAALQSQALGAERSWQGLAFVGRLAQPPAEVEIAGFGSTDAACQVLPTRVNFAPHRNASGCNYE